MRTYVYSPVRSYMSKLVCVCVCAIKSAKERPLNKQGTFTLTARLMAAAPPPWPHFLRIWRLCRSLQLTRNSTWPKSLATWQPTPRSKRFRRAVFQRWENLVREQWRNQRGFQGIRVPDQQQIQAKNLYGHNSIKHIVDFFKANWFHLFCKEHLKMFHIESLILNIF